MIGIVIVAHGGLAGEYLAAMEHVVGHQAGVVAIATRPEDDRSAKQAEICDAADSVDTGAGVVIVTDIFGGSPSNLSLLIKLAKSRQRDVPDAVEAALTAGRKYIDCHQVQSD